MVREPTRSEIRNSTIRTLLDKVGRQSYDKYLVSVRLERIRLFAGATVSFDFPVVALIGPNGGGKTTVLGACGCIYSDDVRGKVFQRSSFGDDGPADWRVDFELIDRSRNPRGTVRGSLQFQNGKWTVSEGKIPREVAFLSLMRTLPLTENPTFHIRGRLTGKANTKNKSVEVDTVQLPEGTSAVIRREGERVLGKSLAEYRFYNVTATTTKWRQAYKWEIAKSPDGNLAQAKIASGKRTQGKRHSISQTMYVGKNEISTFSELNFGAGESSALRIIANIESMPDGSLVLIDEIENGLHPVAVRRLVEYLIDVAERKRIQAIFTSHSDSALDPLPGEAIWACLDGRLQQGKLSVSALRAVSGRVEKRLAIFVEDEFVTHWLASIVRERLNDEIDEIGIYAVGGDGNAVKTHVGHSENPSIEFKSLCYLDGDSKQNESAREGIFRMPGGVPETTVFNDVVLNLSANIALLTIASQRSLDRQSEVERVVRSVAQTNRDPHLLFAQIGERLGFVPEAIIRGAFLAVWIQENKANVDGIVAPIIAILEKQ